jgi:hypothetical protein
MATLERTAIGLVIRTCAKVKKANQTILDYLNRIILSLIKKTS